MFRTENGKAVFTGGKTAYDEAAAVAQTCPAFAEDCEEECTAEEARSCYNCRYRRWTKDSFVCMKGAPK